MGSKRRSKSSNSEPTGMALASQTIKMMFRKKHVKRSLELIGAVAIVYLMLEILEAGNDAPIEAPRGAGSKGKTSCPPGQMCGVDLEAIKKDSSSSETEKPTPEAEIVQDSEAPKPEETPEPEKPAEVYVPEAPKEEPVPEAPAPQIFNPLESGAPVAIQSESGPQSVEQPAAPAAVFNPLADVPAPAPVQSDPGPQAVAEQPVEQVVPEQPVQLAPVAPEVQAQPEAENPAAPVNGPGPMLGFDFQPGSPEQQQQPLVAGQPVPAQPVAGQPVLSQPIALPVQPVIQVDANGIPLPAIPQVDANGIPLPMAPVAAPIAPVASNIPVGYVQDVNGQLVPAPVAPVQAVPQIQVDANGIPLPMAAVAAPVASQPIQVDANGIPLPMALSPQAVPVAPEQVVVAQPTYQQPQPVQIGPDGQPIFMQQPVAVLSPVQQVDANGQPIQYAAAPAPQVDANGQPIQYAPAAAPVAPVAQIAPIAPVAPVYMPQPVDPNAPPAPVQYAPAPVAPQQPVQYAPAPVEPVAPVQYVAAPVEPVAPVQYVAAEPVAPAAPAQDAVIQIDTNNFGGAPADPNAVVVELADEVIDQSMIIDPEFKVASLLLPGEERIQTVNPALPPSRGYLLPMLYFDMGPNNLFRLLRQGAVSAFRLARTVVVPVFHRHPRMGDNAKHPFVLPIFDTNYTVDLVWPADDSIDTEALNQKVHTTDMTTFQKECAGKLDAVIRCGDIDIKREDGLKHFSRAADLGAPQEIRILNMNEIVNEDNTPGHVDISMYRCLGIVYGKKCLPNQEQWLKTYAEVAPFYLRPKTMRFIADKFIQRVMHDQPYLAVHWRYESDWLDMCKPERPAGARKRNGAICKLVMGLSYDQNIRTVFVNNIKAKMTAYGLQSVYLASPPNNIELIRLLNGAFPGNFYYMDDIMKFANETLYPGYLSNNYIASFVEQEVCFKSKFYMGAPLSSWTQSVLVDRLVRGNENHESALDVVTAGSPPPEPPGFPPLIFQFPEGDFKFKF